VADNPAKTMGAKLIGAGVSSDSETQIIGLDLDVLGKKVNFSFAVSKGQAALADIVPLARTICTKITDIVVENLCSNGDHIPCRKGCETCCSHYLVPLSVPEAFRLKEEISHAPYSQRESIWQACLLTTRRIFSKRPPKLLSDQTDGTSLVGPVDLKRVSDWYKNLQLPCPFLHRGVCTIYDQRPLACREHFVKGSAEACKGERDVAEVVRLPVQMPNALAQLALDFEGTTLEAVLLPLVFLWYEQDRPRANKTWPAAMMVERFLEIVKEMASKNYTEVVV
jgi:Fe-S-cluster containining protein